MERGSYFNLSPNTEDAIKTLLKQIINETGNIDEEGVFIELKELLTEARANNTVKETSDTIRSIINQILKKGTPTEKLFSRKLKLPENYRLFSENLGMLNKARKDINNVVDQLYDHINLKLSYATSTKKSILGHTETMFNSGPNSPGLINRLGNFNEPNNVESINAPMLSRNASNNGVSVATVGNNNNRSANFNNRNPLFRERERARNQTGRNRRNRRNLTGRNPRYQPEGNRNRNRHRTSKLPSRSLIEGVNPFSKFGGGGGGGGDEEGNVPY